RVAIDARVDEKRSEDLRAILDAVPERRGKIADVRVALNVVGAATIEAGRPFSIRQDLGGRDVPQAGVAEERRRGRARVVRSRWWWRKVLLCGLSCGSRWNQQRAQPERQKR